MSTYTSASGQTSDIQEVVTLKRVDEQLAEAADEEAAAEQVQALKAHFLLILSKDFYKDECSAEQVTSMESYLPADYANQYEDLPE